MDSAMTLDTQLRIKALEAALHYNSTRSLGEYELSGLMEKFYKFLSEGQK